jgi:DNA-directed RNA polymerase I subunit RPA2
MEYFLSTGNLQSETGLDLMQISGYVMVAERLNYMRFLCHFRSIHRGSFFAEMKTTTVRKLLPEVRVHQTVASLWRALYGVHGTAHATL